MGDRIEVLEWFNSKVGEGRVEIYFESVVSGMYVCLLEDRCAAR